MDFDEEQTLQATLSLDSVSQADLEFEIASLASALAINPNDSQVQAKYDFALHQLSAIRNQPSAILGPLGLSELSIGYSS